MNKKSKKHGWNASQRVSENNTAKHLHRQTKQQAKNGTQQSGNWNSLTAFRDYSLIAGRAFGDERKREREGEGCASQGCCALKLILSRSVEIQLIRDKKHNFGYRVHSNSLDGSH